MWPDLHALVPLLAVIGFFACVGPLMSRHNTACRLLVVGLVAAVLTHYLAWRIPVTLLPADELSAQSLWVWFLFAIEMLALVDAVILFATLLRRTNRSPEADAHETRLRACDPSDLPSVDVFIATYNEPVEVLEKTIVGALCIDWPRRQLNVYVLDDGNRPWLAELARDKGARYLTREGNAHAKAGNINAAIQRTDGDYFLILDADFIPRRDILYRMIGFFEDPKVAIVQAPHNFFNHDPMQANLALRRTLPDDQRLFFDEIMAGRDGWDCAFCCGSNSITRRSAIEEIGNRMPTDSITEDILLTLALMRRGYVTRYLNEKLAIGLAPESLDAFFVQRARWARGGLQLLYLKNGPFGSGLPLRARVMFLPTHWLTQSLVQLTGMAIPAVYLLTGLLPLMNATVDMVFVYQLPALFVILLAMRFFAPGAYFPLAATVLGVLQAFRLLPTVLVTMVKPFGHAFKVTPKGKDAAGKRYDTLTVRLCSLLIGATALGLLLNSDFNSRIIDRNALIPIVAIWSAYNMLILLLVAVTAFAAPARRAEERFELDEPARLRGAFGQAPARLVDLSLSGAQIALDAAPERAIARGDWIWARIDGVGEVPCEVMRSVAGSTRLGVRFYLPTGGERDLLIAKLFTEGMDNATRNENGWQVALGMLSRLFAPDHAPQPNLNAAPPQPPELVLAEVQRTRRTGEVRDLVAGEAKSQVA
jgi:cellulose synthase (UDP-forming)